MGSPGNPGDGGDRPDAARPRVPESDQWLALWRQRLPSDALLPEEEARLIVDAVGHELVGGAPEALDRAGRAWGRAHRSVSAMVERLSALREALAASGVDEPLRMHRALDRITAAATEEVLNRLERASRTDALTGVGNRRAFDETLSAALSAASRQGHQVTLVAVDLDGLKRINDTEGHAAGDAALLALVRAFYATLRDEDTVFRVGGDEFVVVLPFTSVDAAALLMERIQRGTAPAFTWGAAGYPTDSADARSLVEAADQDLYARRQDRRAAMMPLSRRAPVRAARERARRATRWAWVPAAAVVVASLIAALASSTQIPTPTISAGRGPNNPGSSGPTSSGGTIPIQVPANAGSSSGGGSGVSAVTVGFVPSGSGPAGASGSGGGSGGSGGTGGQPSGSGGGGLLGVLEQTLSPVPMVGGNNGLLATVGQLLTGPSQPPVTTTTTHAGLLGLP